MARILPTVDEALARIADNEGPEPRDCEVLGDEVLRLRAEAASKPPLHVVLDRPSDYPEHPVARLAMERDDLRRRLMEAAPRWRDGEPPDGVYVWREGRVAPAETERIRGKMHYIGTNGDAFLWGTARWAPIARPT